MKLIDKLWNWGHLEGSHNAITCLQCSMSPEGFAEKYGVRRSFIVSYSGNIQPPFQGLAARFSPLAEVKWSVLGDSSTPLPAHRLGFAPEIIACAKQYPNITGGIVDDFFSPERKKRFPPEVLREIRAELNGLVGLGAVKEYVFGLADNLQVQQRRAAAGFKTASLSMHMIFTGNPGTGKTTIARLVAKYLKAIGALKGGQLVEVSRGDLVGRYTGHTAPLTNSVIQSALGGVLFIDEAYSLYRGEQDSFGLEAIDTLVKGMEDHRDELVVILAGYTREMETFLTANSGLASRFPNKIEFPDYTADELLDITNVLARGKGYRLAESCTEPLRGYYERRQAEDARTAGNGRLARNTLEKAIFNQSRRLVAEPAAELDVILPGDLEL